MSKWGTYYANNPYQMYIISTGRTHINREQSTFGSLERVRRLQSISRIAFLVSALDDSLADD